MPPSITDLEPQFQPDAQRVIDLCAASGIEMRVNETIRSPLDQARIWRQSRAIEEIQAKIAEFRAAGAGFLADCIESAGPQHGDHVTNTPPGLSWHQWGEALDCFWVVDGKAEWSTTRKVNGRNGYQVYAATAKQEGVDAGGLWRTFKDWPHIQFRTAGSALGVFTLQEIDTTMRQRFGQP